MHACVCVYACMHVCMYVCVYVRMCVCVYDNTEYRRIHMYHQYASVVGRTLHTTSTNGVDR